VGEACLYVVVYGDCNQGSHDYMRTRCVYRNVTPKSQLSHD
jgi:hypothetical protein